MHSAVQKRKLCLHCAFRSKSQMRKAKNMKIDYHHHCYSTQFEITQLKTYTELYHFDAPGKMVVRSLFLVTISLCSCVYADMQLPVNFTIFR